MARDTSAALVREVVQRLGRAGLNPEELLFEVSLRVGHVIPHDAAGWMTLDPDTLLPSTTLETAKSSALVRAMWRVEARQPTPTALRALVLRPAATVSTSDLDVAVAEASPRVHVMRSAGLGDDLRAPLHARGQIWGLGVLYRADGEPPFNARERAFMGTIAGDIGEGLRRSLTRPPAAGAGVLLPGVVVFAADGSLRSMTDEAERMTRLIEGDAASTLYAVAARAESGAGAHARLRLADGRWVQIDGAPLTGGPAGARRRTAVTLLPASETELTSLLLRLHGLTVRERRVAELLIAGRTPEEVALTLRISRRALKTAIGTIRAKAGLARGSELQAIVSGYVPSDVLAAGGPDSVETTIPAR